MKKFLASMLCFAMVVIAGFAAVGCGTNNNLTYKMNIINKPAGVTFSRSGANYLINTTSEEGNTKLGEGLNVKIYVETGIDAEYCNITVDGTKHEKSKEVSINFTGTEVKVIIEAVDNPDTKKNEAEQYKTVEFSIKMGSTYSAEA